MQTLQEQNLSPTPIFQCHTETLLGIAYKTPVFDDLSFRKTITRRTPVEKKSPSDRTINVYWFINAWVVVYLIAKLKATTVNFPTKLQGKVKKHEVLMGPFPGGDLHSPPRQLFIALQCSFMLQTTKSSSCETKILCRLTWSFRYLSYFIRKFYLKRGIFVLHVVSIRNSR